jgi:hypothetical protein
MVIRFFLLVLLIFNFFSSFSQELSIKGQILDAQTKQPLPGANIVVKETQTNLQYGESTGSTGRFEIKGLKKGNYILTVSFLGYKTNEQPIALVDKSVNLPAISLELANKNLNEVRVNGLMNRQEQRGDTTIFNADAFKVNVDASTEDLIKKMPGITIEGSTVKAGGEQVKKVLVDGKEFFGNDPMLALKNLQADMVDKIEVYDRQSDQAKFTGFDDGKEERTINIATKRGVANGKFGKVYAGYGSDSRYEGGGNINIFNGNRRISVLGLFNNINQQNFSVDEVSGGGGGQRRSGGGRSGGGGASTQGSAGITKTNAIGVNYTDLWGKKVEVNSSYFFNNTQNTNNSTSLLEYFPTSDGVQMYDEVYRSSSKSYNHRFNVRLIYAMDSLNSLYFTPNVSWQENTNNSNSFGTDYLNQLETAKTEGYTENDSRNFSLNGDLMYRHKFMKDKRTISLRFGTSSSYRNDEGTTFSLKENLEQQDNDLLTNQFSTNKSKSYGYNTDLIYTEPLSPNSMLMFNYSPSITKSEGDENVYDNTLTGEGANIPVENLSSNTVSDYIQQRGGLGYNYTNKELNLVAILNYQNAELIGNRIDAQNIRTNEHFTSFIPSLILRYKKANTTNLRLIYRTNTNAPSISQLQDVVDISNTRAYSSGNSDLKQQYSHNMMVFLNKNNMQTSRSFSIMGGVTSTSDYIATSSIIAARDSIVGNDIVLRKGTQFDKPVNMNGFLSLRTNITYSFPLTSIKSNINLNAGGNFQSKPGVYNYRNIKSDTYTINGGIVIGSSISKELDFTLSYNASYNIIESSAVQTDNYNYFNHRTELEFNYVFLTRMVFNNSVRQTYYTGLGDDFDQNYFLWNAGLGVKFLKDNRAELRLKVYDLLNQNRSVSRSIKDAYVETTNTNILTQYALLTFTYRLKGKGNAPEQNRQRHGEFNPGGMRMRGEGNSSNMSSPDGF